MDEILLAVGCLAVFIGLLVVLAILVNLFTGDHQHRWGNDRAELGRHVRECKCGARQHRVGGKWGA